MAAATVFLCGVVALVVVNIAAARSLTGEPVTSGVLDDVRDELGDTEAFVPVELVATVLTGLERRANDRALARVRDATLLAGVLLLPVSAAAGWLLSREGAAGREAGRDAAPATPLPPPVREAAAGPVAATAAFRRLVEETSHELRNPLAVITTNLDLVVSAPPDADTSELHRAAQSALRAARRMAATLDGLTSEALAGESADREPIDLDPVVASVVEEFAPPAAARGVSLSRVPGGPAATVRGDRLALRRALANLVANAVRLAPPGTEIRCAAGSEAGWAWCGVADEGPGIPADLQGRIFERGWRAADDAGEGLGLWIVRQVAEVHGGCVRVHSAVGVGTHLVIWLPGAAGAGPAPEPPEHDPLGPLGGHPGL